MEFNFYGATQGWRWMAVSKESSGVLDTSLLGGALFGLPSAFIRGFVSRQRYVLFTTAQKIICLHSFHSCHLCVARQSTMGLNTLGNKSMDTKRRRKKNLKRDITCMAEALGPCIVIWWFEGMKKVYVTGEEYVFVSAQTYHVPHMWSPLLLNIRFIITISIVFFYCDLDVRGSYHPSYKQGSFFFSFGWNI